jgi:hypothetical protein
MQLDIPEPRSITAMVKQHQRDDQVWTIHNLGKAIAVCHHKECGLCLKYVGHVLSHPGSFNLLDKDVMGAIEKAWLHFISALEQKLTCPSSETMLTLPVSSSALPSNLMSSKTNTGNCMTRTPS